MTAVEKQQVGALEAEEKNKCAEEGVRKEVAPLQLEIEGNYLMVSSGCSLSIFHIKRDEQTQKIETLKKVNEVMQESWIRCYHYDSNSHKLVTAMNKDNLICLYTFEGSDDDVNVNQQNET
jgi:6-phosphogluconolactonase (cycloisomerase 2 family)